LRGLGKVEKVDRAIGLVQRLITRVSLTGLTANGALLIGHHSIDGR